MMKSKKKQLTAVDLAKELDNLIADSDKVETMSDISDWLVRLYTAAGNFTIVQKRCRNRQFTGEAMVAAKQIVDEYVPNMFLLHQLAEKVLIKIPEVKTNNERICP